MNITASAAWKAIEAHRQSLSPVHLRELFARDPGRVASLSLSFDGILYDFSKQRIDSTTPAAAGRAGPRGAAREWTERMFSGEQINASEDRSVLHVALRRSRARSPRPIWTSCPRFSRRGSGWPLLPTLFVPVRRSVSPACRFARGQYRHRWLRPRPEDARLRPALDVASGARRALRLQSRQRSAGAAAADARPARRCSWSPARPSPPRRRCSMRRRRVTGCWPTSAMPPPCPATSLP
jgi:hypothetical protein